jgi:MFS family permease
VQAAEAQAPDVRTNDVGGPYAWYVLGVLVLVYMINFIDRQIISILAEDIKADLGVSDADMGFLYGTAFGVFYSLFGIPLGRLADMWYRGRLMTIGLAVWSAMTAVSGFAQNFGHLAAARIGVGIGEATASPCAFSMISDYFPKERRATALAVYSSGLYLGGGLSLFIGGAIVQSWNAAYPGGGPLGLVGWQAAFLAVGLPGLLLALWVATLREPARGMADGHITPPEPKPWGKFFTELSSIVPPLTILHAAGHGMRALTVNLAALVLIAAAAWAMVALTGDTLQWAAIGLGAYAVFSWSQSLKLRDPATYKLIWGTPAFVLTVVGFGLIAFGTYAHGFWAAPYAIREFAQPLIEAGRPVPWYAETKWIGLFLGGGAAAAGFIGVILGGSLADRFRRTNPSGRILVGFVTILGTAPLVIWQYTTDSIGLFYALAFVNGIFASAWVGVAAATTQDLVLPRMRGAATATYFLGTTFLGLALGPYCVGKVSVVTGDLGLASISVLVMAPITLACLALVYRWLPQAEASRFERSGETPGVQS